VKYKLETKASPRRQWTDGRRILVRVTNLQIWGIGTKEVNRLQYDFLLARYLKCPKMVDGPLHHFAKCHFGGHL